MKRIKIFKVYFILWLFVYFIAISNIESFKLYFMSTLTFNIAIVTLLAIGTIMLLRGAKDLVMIAGTFGVLMYKKNNLSFYIRGIEKVFPTNIAHKIKRRAEQGMLIFTQQEKEEILSWIDEQFANQNKYNNFFIGTVLMIGLLGTFSGLLGAIGNMGSIVMSLSGSNIDIGKIMASFSGPLSSMAVGFGSSLFGVISAILLSIKGYLLNRSQATVLDGVENWLNANTVESIEPVSEAAERKEALAEKKPGFMDLFVDKMGALHHEIATLNRNNHEMKEAFSATVELMKNMQAMHYKTLQGVMHSLQTLHEEKEDADGKIAHYMAENIRMQEQQHRLLHSLVRLHEDEKTELVDLHTQMEDLSYLMQKKSPKEDPAIAQFQLLETLENMQNTILHELRKKEGIETHKKDNAERKESFLQKHFSRKSDNAKEKV